MFPQPDRNITRYVEIDIAKPMMLIEQSKFAVSFLARGGIVEIGAAPTVGRISLETACYYFRCMVPIPDMSIPCSAPQVSIRVRHALIRWVASDS